MKQRAVAEYHYVDDGSDGPPRKYHGYALVPLIAVDMQNSAHNMGGGAKIWERNPRSGSLQPRWLRHRFPIKGGSTCGEMMRDMLAHSMEKSNVLLRDMLSRKLYS